MRKAGVNEEGPDIVGENMGNGTATRGEGHGSRILPLLALTALALALLAFSLIYFLVPGLLPWSEARGQVDPSAMLAYYDPAEAMRGDQSLIEESYAAEDPPWGDDDIFSLMIIGNDYDYSKNGRRATDSAGRADTIMLLIVPKKGMSAALISIPRDTMVKNAYGYTVKMNSLYREPVPSALMTEVRSLTGVPVDRWVSVDFAGFEDIVDILGGVEINVQKRMQYKDNAGGYTIDLWPGLHHFDGAGALCYVRYRSDALGDIARVERQLGFVRALAGKAISWNTAGRLFALLYTARRNVESDLSYGEAFALGVRLLRTGMNAISTWKAPGVFNGTYWQVDRAALRDSISKLME